MSQKVLCDESIYRSESIDLSLNKLKINLSKSLNFHIEKGLEKE